MVQVISGFEQMVDRMREAEAAVHSHCFQLGFMFETFNNDGPAVSCSDVAKAFQRAKMTALRTAGVKFYDVAVSAFTEGQKWYRDTKQMDKSGEPQ